MLARRRRSPTGAAGLIPERALKRDTGARALRAVTEEIMLDRLYTLPDTQQGVSTRLPRTSWKAARTSSRSSQGCARIGLIAFQTAASLNSNPRCRAFIPLPD